MEGSRQQMAVATLLTVVVQRSGRMQEILMVINGMRGCEGCRTVKNMRFLNFLTKMGKTRRVIRLWGNHGGLCSEYVDFEVSEKHAIEACFHGEKRMEVQKRWKPLEGRVCLGGERLQREV